MQHSTLLQHWTAPSYSYGEHTCCMCVHVRACMCMCCVCVVWCVYVVCVCCVSMCCVCVACVRVRACVHVYVVCTWFDVCVCVCATLTSHSPHTTSPPAAVVTTAMPFQLQRPRTTVEMALVGTAVTEPLPIRVMWCPLDPSPSCSVQRTWLWDGVCSY